MWSYLPVTSSGKWRLWMNSNPDVRNEPHLGFFRSSLDPCNWHYIARQSWFLEASSLHLARGFLRRKFCPSYQKAIPRVWDISPDWPRSSWWSWGWYLLKPHSLHELAIKMSPRWNVKIRLQPWRIAFRNSYCGEGEIAWCGSWYINPLKKFFSSALSSPSSSIKGIKSFSLRDIALLRRLFESTGRCWKAHLRMWFAICFTHHWSVSSRIIAYAFGRGHLACSVE